MITMAATISRVPMGITVARMMMVVVERPLLPLLPLSLVPPLVVMELEVIPMLAMVVPLVRIVLRLFCEVMAELEPATASDDTCMVTLTEPFMMLCTTIF